jgi:hypothetical protein
LLITTAYFREMGCTDERYTELAHDRFRWRSLILAVLYFQLSENELMQQQTEYLNEVVRTRLVFGMSRVRIPVWRIATFTEIICGFSQLLQVNVRTVPQKDHSASFQDFIFHSHGHLPFRHYITYAIQKRR